jgi:hypothetical protein
MSYSNAKRRRIKPFARPTSFDINVAYDIRHYQQTKYGNVVDPYFPAVGTDEAFKVLEGEVLMQQDKPNVRRYGDHQMHVFSFANGLKANGYALNASAPENRQPTKAAVLAGLRYAGVAVTEFTPEKDVFEQGFVMTMGGLNTLFNNGASTIYPGDVICADIPNPADAGARKNRGLQTGVPHEKLQFIVTPFRLLSDATKEGGVDPRLAARFIMGTALSYSRPGAPLDVVLHKCNMIVGGGGFGAVAVDEQFGERLNSRKTKATLASAESKKPKVKAVKKKPAATSKN